MTNLIRIFCFLLNFSLFLGATEIKTCDEFLHFTFDKRGWKEGNSQETKDGSIMEFILPGESVDNWSELITVQRFLPIGGTPDDYYKLYIKTLEKEVNGAKVESKIIKQDKDSIFFEWWINSKIEHPQHEWFKLMKTNNSTLILRYTTKNLDEVEKIRPIWEKILNDAHYTQEGDCPGKKVEEVEKKGPAPVSSIGG